MKHLVHRIALLAWFTPTACACTASPSPPEERDDVLPEITDVADLAPADLAVEPARAEVSLRIRRSSVRDGAEGQTFSPAIADDSLAVGGTTTLYVVTGHGRDCDWSGAGGPITAEGIPREAEHVRHLWRATVERRPADLGRIRLDVRWEHFFNPDGEPHVTNGGAKTVDLSEGGSNVLDVIGHSSGDLEPCPATLQVDVQAEIEEDPAFADRLLTYDLWYEHRASGERVAVRHYLGGGRQGKNVPFELPSLDLAVPGGNEGERLELGLSGTLQGRWHGDDTIAVLIAATRRVALREGDEAPSGSLSNSGTEVFALRPGQTIRMVLPPLSGKMGAIGPVDPALVAGGALPELRVDLGETFAGHEDDLVLTVRDGDAP